MLASRIPSWSECKIVFGSLLALNALVRLASYWSVRIKSVTAFKQCADWRDATHCKVSDAEVSYIPALLVPHAFWSCPGGARHICRQEEHGSTAAQDPGKLSICKTAAFSWQVCTWDMSCRGMVRQQKQN